MKDHAQEEGSLVRTMYKSFKEMQASLVLYVESVAIAMLDMLLVLESHRNEWISTFST